VAFDQVRVSNGTAAIVQSIAAVLSIKNRADDFLSIKQLPAQQLQANKTKQ
jgi:hypothetical protein